ncbi:MAG: winged helix-turn-helix domain-containing protein [Thermoplasmataceae archaeon]|jgi:DNA-binding MarR family transcriptional regulator
MTENYGIAILDREGEYIVKPFFSDIPKISKLTVICDLKTEFKDSKSEIIGFLKLTGVKSEFIEIDDVGNFFQIFLVLQKICKSNGTPAWVNISCGSGIGVSALTIHAFNQNILMVVYDKYKDATSVINVKKLKKINIYSRKYISLMKEISINAKTTRELSIQLKITNSATSRRLKKLLSLDVIRRNGSGTRNYPYYYSLTEFGKILLL